MQPLLVTTGPGGGSLVTQKMYLELTERIYPN